MKIIGIVVFEPWNWFNWDYSSTHFFQFSFSLILINLHHIKRFLYLPS